MDSSNIHSDHCLSDTDTDTNTVPSQVVPGLRSPRPGMEDDTQSFEFMAYDDSDHPDDIVETDMDTFIHKTDSGNSGNGSALSAKGDVSNNLQQKKSRKRRRPAVSSSLEAHEHIQLKNDNSTASENNNNSHSTHDHFLSVIQEQIPHLEEPVSQRKRSSSISSSKGSHTESLSPPPLLPSPPPPSPDSTMLTVRPFVPAPEPSVPRKKTLSKKPKQHSHSGPKRPRTAYIIFLEHFRQTYNELYPNTNFNDCQKLAGKKWRSLSAVEKQPWKEQERLSQKDFIHKMHGLQHAFGLVEGPPVSPPSSINSAAAVNPRHREETQNNFAQQHQQKGDDSDNEEETRKRYLEESGENMSNKIDLSDEAAHSSSTSIAVHQHQMRKILDATVPNKMTELMKGPKNAFSMFVHSMREECQKKDPTLSYNEIQRQLSVQWRQMDHEDKQVWTAKADEVKRQLHAYNAALAQKGLTGDNNKDMRKYKKGIALPKGPRSAYTLFYQCARKQLYALRPTLSFQEYPTICSQIWREMPAEEKILWKTDSVNDKIRYEQELLVLARSEVANTATSIVMEENLEKKKREEKMGKIISTHMPTNISGSSISSSSSSGSCSSSDSSSSSSGSGDGTFFPSTCETDAAPPALKRRRGPYKKRQVKQEMNALSVPINQNNAPMYTSSSFSSADMSSTDNNNDDCNGNNMSASSFPAMAAPPTVLSSSISSSHSGDQFAAHESKRHHMSSSSSGLFGREHGTLGILEYPATIDESNGEAWMDISFSHNHDGHLKCSGVEEDEETVCGGGCDNIAATTGNGASHGESHAVEASKKKTTLLSTFSRDSLEEQSTDPPPMVGIGKRTLLHKSPTLVAEGRRGIDFSAAGMTSKMCDDDDGDDDLCIEKSYSSSSHTHSLSPQTHHSRDKKRLKEREGGHDLYSSHLQQSSSDSQHHLEEQHTLMPFSSFEEFREI